MVSLPRNISGTKVGSLLALCSKSSGPICAAVQPHRVHVALRVRQRVDDRKTVDNKRSARCVLPSKPERML